MRSGERQELARAAYWRAIALARAECTPASWRRVLAAARNLAEASRAADGPRAGAERHDASRREAARTPGGRPAATERSRVAMLGAAAEGPELRGPDPWGLDRGAPHPTSTPPCWRLARWPALAAEWERSRALMAESRRIVEESHALVAQVRRLGVERLWMPDAARP